MYSIIIITGHFPKQYILKMFLIFFSIYSPQEVKLLNDYIYIIYTFHDI